MIPTVDNAVAGFVPNVPVMPAGQFDAASVTGLLKPFAGVIVTVDVPVDPATAKAPVELRAKLGAAFTVREIEVFADNVPLTPVTGKV